MVVRNKLYRVYYTFYILLLPLCSFAQSEEEDTNRITPNDRRYAWVFEMVETARLYEKEDSTIYKVDYYYKECINNRIKNLENCEICAQYSLTKSDSYIKSLFMKVYLSSKNTNYQKMMLDMDTKWWELRDDMEIQRKLLTSKMALTPKNYILLYYQELIMTNIYTTFLKRLSYCDR